MKVCIAGSRDFDDYEFLVEQCENVLFPYHTDDIESLILNLGGEASFNISTEVGVLTPQLRIEWAHQVEDLSLIHI